MQISILMMNDFDDVFMAISMTCSIPYGEPLFRHIDKLPVGLRNKISSINSKALSNVRPDYAVKFISHRITKS